MRFRNKPRQAAHACAMFALALTPLVVNTSSAPEPEEAKPRAAAGRAVAQPAVSAALTTTSRSATRFALLEDAEPVDEGGSDRGVQVTSPKGTRVWTASALTDNDLPLAAQRAYRRAARTMAGSDPACQLPWTLLAGIGRVESDHGRYGGSVLGDDGVSRPRIIGVQLNGAGPVAAIRDTDNGRLDGDKVWDRAVGPMQFIPSTWAGAARDGDGDGVATPNDLDDASLAAAGYLCSGAGSVREEAGMKSAVYRYNQDDYYVALVMAFERGYRTGDFTLPPPPAEETTDKPRKKKRDAGEANKPARKQRSGATRPGDSTRTGTDKPSAGDSGTSSPKPKPSSSPRPKPSASPSPSPTTKPKPSPSPSPTPTGPRLEQVTGSFTACGAASGWCLGQTPLDLGPESRLGERAAADFSGDQEVATNAGEFEAMRGGQVQLLVENRDGVAVVYAINGEDYRYADGSFA